VRHAHASFERVVRAHFDSHSTNSLTVIVIANLSILKSDLQLKKNHTMSKELKKEQMTYSLEGELRR